MAELTPTEVSERIPVGKMFMVHGRVTVTTAAGFIDLRRWLRRIYSATVTHEAALAEPVCWLNSDDTSIQPGRLWIDTATNGVINFVAYGR